MALARVKQAKRSMTGQYMPVTFFGPFAFHGKSCGCRSSSQASRPCKA